MQSKLCCAEIVLHFHTLCALCSICFTGFLAMSVLCMSFSILLASFYLGPRSRRTKCWFSFYIWSFLSIIVKYLKLTASGLNFKIAVKSALALSTARTMWRHLELRRVKILRLHFRCIPVVIAALLVTFLKNYWQWGSVSFCFAAYDLRWIVKVPAI